MARFSPIVRAFLRDARSQTRIVLAWELPTIMRKHIATGAMGTLYFALLSGIYLVAFGNAIGLEYWQWGLLSSLSYVVLVLQLNSAYIVRRTGYRKSIWFLSALGARLLRALAVVLAFFLFGRSKSLACTVFIVLIVFSNSLDAICAPPWLSWLADIIPRDSHGRFMGRRSSWIAFANVCTVVPIGYLMDRYGGNGSLTALMLVFAFGSVVGISDLFIHRTIPEPRMVRPPKKSFWQELAIPLKDRAFRPWLIFNALWMFSTTLGGALATIYIVENLGIRQNFFGGSLVLILTPLLASIVCARWIGRMIDRHGVKPVLWWGHRMWATLPLFWLVATRSNAMVWLCLGSLVGGIGSEAGLMAANKLVTRLRSPDHVPMYSAASACVGAIAGAIGPILAGLVLNYYKGTSWTIGGFVIGGFHITFAASLALRHLSTIAIHWIQEPEAAAGRPSS